ncbi:hypothetical protein F5Y03DRAFT_380118 [Xylaria venustula]|nr:hypothetical protein F5Y03DRAFT_380118 [Xylaria venustula]
MDSSASAETFNPEDPFERSQALMRRVESKLEEKGHADLVKPFRTAASDFMTEFVTLVETQATLWNVLEHIEDESLRDEFAAFLDAPLDTDEQQAIARAALCQILGVGFTIPWPKNHKIVFELLEKILVTAGRSWLPSERRERFRRFTRRLGHPYDKVSDEEQKRKDLLEMAASESCLQALLEEMWRVLDGEV